MAFNKKKYDSEYNRTQVKCKRIPFNKNNKDDQIILEWLEKQGNVTQYVKRLIRADMEGKTPDSLSIRLSDII